MGVNIDRADMAHWTILCAERYLSILYDYLHKCLYDYHVIQADETPVRVTKEDRTEGDKHYMWVYRTGKCMRISRSSCMITSRHVKQTIQGSF